MTVAQWAAWAILAARVLYPDVIGIINAIRRRGNAVPQNQAGQVQDPHRPDIHPPAS